MNAQLSTYIQKHVRMRKARIIQIEYSSLLQFHYSIRKIPPNYNIIETKKGYQIPSIQTRLFTWNKLTVEKSGAARDSMIGWSSGFVYKFSTNEASS